MSSAHIPLNVRFQSLDALRGIAALGVTLFHISIFLSYPAYPLLQKSIWVAGKIGAMGVDIFFVISGICITLIYRRSLSFELFPFWKRRWIRLWPTFGASVVITATIFVWNGSLEQTEAAVSIFKNCLLLPAFPSIPESSILGGSWLIAIYWTLAYEAQFYLFFPVLAWCWEKFGWQRTQYVMLMISVISYLWNQDAGLFINRYFQFLLGCQLCSLFHPASNETSFSWKHLLITNLIIAITALKGFRWAGTILAESLILIFALYGKQRVVIPISDKLSKIGVFSYSLYLYHGILISLWFQMIQHFTPSVNGFVFAVTALPASILGSFLMFRLVERHFL